MHETSPYFQNLDYFLQGFDFFFPENHLVIPSKILFGANPNLGLFHCLFWISWKILLQTHSRIKYISTCMYPYLWMLEHPAPSVFTITRAGWLTGAMPCQRETQHSAVSVQTKQILKISILTDPRNMLTFFCNILYCSLKYLRVRWCCSNGWSTGLKI